MCEINNFSIIYPNLEKFRFDDDDKIGGTSSYCCFLFQVKKVCCSFKKIYALMKKIYLE